MLLLLETLIFLICYSVHDVSDKRDVVFIIGCNFRWSDAFG